MGARGRKELLTREFAKWTRVGGDGKRTGKARRLEGRLFSDPVTLPASWAAVGVRQAFGKSGRCFSRSLKRGLCPPWARQLSHSCLFSQRQQHSQLCLPSWPSNKPSFREAGISGRIKAWPGLRTGLWLGLGVCPAQPPPWPWAVCPSCRPSLHPGRMVRAGQGRAGAAAGPLQGVMDVLGISGLFPAPVVPGVSAFLKGLR